jgi:RhtB (resistance to homoserine/threonine) family protein
MLDLLAFLSINLLGVMSPGPDFAIVTHYGLKGSRQGALYAALGISAAVIVHALYCVFGLALFIQSSPKIFLALQILGAVYLAYLGIQMLRPAKISPLTSMKQAPESKAFMTGFLTNLLNPKATLFLLSLFTQFINPDTSLAKKISFGMAIPCTALAWFSLLALLLTHPPFLPRLQHHQRKFSLAMGSLLLILAVSVVWKAFIEIPHEIT